MDTKPNRTKKIIPFNSIIPETDNNLLNNNKLKNHV